jgi:hypothetical protein
VTVSQLPSPILPAVPSFTPENVAELAESKKHFKKIFRAINYAKFDAWTVGIFGGLTLIVGLGTFSLVGVLLGAGMSYVAYSEFMNASALRKLDLNSPKKLAINQVVLGSLLMAYAIYMLLTSHVDMSQYADLAGAGQMGAKMADDLKQMTTLAFRLVYFALIAIAIFAQGGTALFYLSREKFLRRYLEHTPAWIVEMQRAGISV